VVLCTDLILELNEKYADQDSGLFFLFHRHRTYNPREKSWMGWERKRGKLLDLNKLLREQYDSFPVKVGELSILPSVRFVITLDSDTEFARGVSAPNDWHHGASAEPGDYRSGEQHGRGRGTEFCSLGVGVSVQKYFALAAGGDLRGGDWF